MPELSRIVMSVRLYLMLAVIAGMVYSTIAGPIGAYWE